MGRPAHTELLSLFLGKRTEINLAWFILTPSRIIR